MSQEQSIDDILRLLKESVAEQDEKPAPKKGGRKKAGKLAEDAHEDGKAEESYAIDPEFLKEAQLEAEAEKIQESERSDDLAPWEEEEEELPEEEEELPEEEEELPEEEEELPEEEEELPEEEEELPEEEEELPEEEEELPGEEEELPEEEEELPEEEEELPEEEEELPEEEEELPEEEEELPEEEEELLEEEEELPEEEEEFPEEEGIDYFSEEDFSDENFDAFWEELKEESEEIIYEMPEESLTSLPLEKLDENPLVQETSAPEQPLKKISSTPLSPAMVELMKQFGCEHEIPELGRRETREDEQKREENTLTECNSRLKKKEKQTFLRMIAMAAITVLSLIYDLLPRLDADLSGMLDYTEFAGSYLLIGLQLLIFGAVCLWKPLLGGIKKLFSSSADLYSAVFLMLIFTAAYDISLAFFLREPDLPPMFHFVGCLVMLIVLGTEFAMLRRRVHLIEILSSPDAKYTLTRPDGEHSLSEKMYEGGMDRSTRVYVPASVSSFAQYDLEHEENSTHSRFMTGSLIPISLLVIATGVLGMVFEKSLRDAFTAAMIMLFTTLPLTSLAAICIPLWFSAGWMKKRGSALGDLSSIRTYAGCHSVVFSDRYLFRKCRLEDTGIQVCEPDQNDALTGALEILYEHLGGPMKGLFQAKTEESRFDSLRIRRIGRGGVEAFVGRKHILLVGDEGFMSRYGLTFPKDKDPRQRKTLCVSLDGKVSAKISVRYEVEPLFEMLVNRMAKEGVSCVIETYDPLIGSEYIASVRRKDSAPISVVHKNADDLYREQSEPTRKVQEAKMAVTASRLKLAEALVWCRRIINVYSKTGVMGFIFSGVGVILTASLLAFDRLAWVNEYWLALYALLPLLSVSILTLFFFPKRFYFTVEIYERELIRKDLKREKEEEKIRAKRAKKKAKFEKRKRKKHS